MSDFERKAWLRAVDEAAMEAYGRGDMKATDFFYEWGLALAYTV